MWGNHLNLEELEKNLIDKEQEEYNALIDESRAVGHIKTVRSELAKLVRSVLERLGEHPNPGPLIAEFASTYVPTEPETQASSNQTIELKPADSYPQFLAQPLSKVQNPKQSMDGASMHKALLDLGEAVLVYLTAVMFGEYRQSWQLNEDMEAEFYRNAKRKPSFGVFLGFLRRLSKVEGDSILDHLFQKKTVFEAVSQFVLVFDQLTQMINQGADENFQPELAKGLANRTASKKGLLQFYDAFITMRNNYAHPEDKAKNPDRKWPLGEDYYQLINPYVTTALEELLANINVLTEYKPVLIQGIDKVQQQAQAIVQTGSDSVANQINLQSQMVEVLQVDSHYLLDHQGQIYTRLFYNEVPALEPSIAQKIISREKAKMLEPVLKKMIHEFLEDDAEIDQDEYFTLQLTAQSADIHNDDLTHIITKCRKELGLEESFEIIESHQTQVRGPIFNGWWINYFLLRQGIAELFSENKISDVRKGKSEEVCSSEFFHQLIWTEITAYVKELKEQFLDDEIQRWTLLPNKWQMGKLTGYFWAQLFPEETPLGRVFSTSIFIHNSGAIVRYIPHYDKLRTISSSFKNINLLIESSKICAKFLDDNKDQLMNYEILIDGWQLSLIPEHKKEYDYFLNEFYPDYPKKYIQEFRLPSYYEKVHDLAKSGQYLIYEITWVSALNPTDSVYSNARKMIDECQEIGFETAIPRNSKELPVVISSRPDEVVKSQQLALKLFSSITSKITDYAIEQGLSEKEALLVERQYIEAKGGLTKLVKNKIDEVIVDNEVGADDYDALLQFVYENDFKFNDFLELKKEFEGKGIVFHDGSFVNEVNENDIEWLGICLDKFVNQYQERFTGLTDDKEKRVKEFQNSLHYSLKMRTDEMTAFLGFRITYDRCIFAMLRIEGHWKNPGQLNAFMFWVSDKTGWTSVDKKGNYNLYLTGRKPFSIEKQIKWPGLLGSDENKEQLDIILLDLLHEWENAKTGINNLITR